MAAIYVLHYETRDVWDDPCSIDELSLDDLAAPQFTAIAIGDDDMAAKLAEVKKMCEHQRTEESDEEIFTWKEGPSGDATSEGGRWYQIHRLFFNQECVGSIVIHKA